MTPHRVVHLLGDTRLGGVVRMIHTLVEGGALADIDQALRAADRPQQWGAACRDADIIVLHDSLSWRLLPWLMLLRAGRPRAKIILVEHTYCAGFERHRVPARGRFRLMLALSYALFDKVVAVSAAQRRWMLDARLLAPAKIQVIYPHLDYSRLLRLQTPAATRRLRIGAIGRLHKQKGFDRLIRAVRALGRRDIEVLIAGEGPQNDVLKTLAHDLSQVHFYGRADDVAQFMRQVDIVVVPSRYEPFGIVAAEARAAGRPILVTASDGLAEQVVPGAGWVIENDTQQALIEALNALPTRRELRAAGALARESLTGEYEVSMHRWRMLLTSP
ncbi:MAG: glycosyltransferase [Pseudomonadota bacterium]